MHRVCVTCNCGCEALCLELCISSDEAIERLSRRNRHARLWLVPWLSITIFPSLLVGGLRAFPVHGLPDGCCVNRSRFEQADRGSVTWTVGD